MDIFPKVKGKIRETFFHYLFHGNPVTAEDTLGAYPATFTLPGWSI
jgi:hypothetical protein